MRSLSPSALLTLVVLAGVAQAQPASASLGTGGRRIEVRAEVDGTHTVFIAPGLSTTLLFNATLVREAVELEERHFFKWVEVGESSVSLVPAEHLAAGRRLLLRVRFMDGRLPLHAVFTLEVSPSRVERQVEIDRLPLSCESCMQQLREARAEAQQCQGASREGGSEPCGAGGLTGLLVSGLMGSQGVHSNESLGDSDSEAPLKVARVISYRAFKRIAVVLVVHPMVGTAPWRVERATLSHEEGEVLRVLTVWPRRPLPPGAKANIIVEAEAEMDEARKAYVLTLHEAEGGRTLVLRNVKFP